MSAESKTDRHRADAQDRKEFGGTDAWRNNADSGQETGEDDAQMRQTSQRVAKAIMVLGAGDPPDNTANAHRDEIEQREHDERDRQFGEHGEKTVDQRCQRSPCVFDFVGQGADDLGIALVFQ